MAYGLKTYSDTAREDLLDIIANIKPEISVARQAYNEGVASQPSRQIYEKRAKLLETWIRNMKIY